MMTGFYIDFSHCMVAVLFIPIHSRSISRLLSMIANKMAQEHDHMDTGGVEGTGLGNNDGEFKGTGVQQRTGLGNKHGETGLQEGTGLGTEDGDKEGTGLGNKDGDFEGTGVQQGTGLANKHGDTEGTGSGTKVGKKNNWEDGLLLLLLWLLLLLLLLL